MGFLSDITLLPATLAHVRELQKTLRQADRLEGMRIGIDPVSGVYWSYRCAILRRTALVDGEVAAMWGVGGEMLGSVGRPYLLTSAACERVHPIRFARIYFDEAREMLRMFPRLENWVDSRYSGAVRLLRLAGFTLDDPVPVGRSGEMFRRFEMVA